MYIGLLLLDTISNYLETYHTFRYSRMSGQTRIRMKYASQTCLSASGFGMET